LKFGQGKMAVISKDEDKNIVRINHMPGIPLLFPTD